MSSRQVAGRIFSEGRRARNSPFHLLTLLSLLASLSIFRPNASLPFGFPVMKGQAPEHVLAPATVALALAVVRTKPANTNIDGTGLPVDTKSH